VRADWRLIQSMKHAGHCRRTGVTHNSCRDRARTATAASAHTPCTDDDHCRRVTAASSAVYLRPACLARLVETVIDSAVSTLQDCTAPTTLSTDSMILRVQGSAGTANRRTWRLPWAAACPGCMHDSASSQQKDCVCVCVCVCYQ